MAERIDAKNIAVKLINDLRGPTALEALSILNKDRSITGESYYEPGARGSDTVSCWCLGQVGRWAMYSVMA